MLDNSKLLMGNDGDLQIYHDGTHSYIYQDGTGELRINAATFRVMDKNGGETQIRAAENGSVVLCNDGTTKLETTSSGAQITNGTGNAQLNIRGGSSDGSATIQFITDDNASNNDNFRLQGNPNNYFYLQNYASGNWETNIRAFGNGGVRLYHDNSMKFETNSTGIEVTSSTDSRITITAGNAISQAGINFADNSGIDGIITYNHYTRTLHLGAGTSSFTDGELNITSNGVELLCDGSQKLKTISGGVDISGWARPTTDDYWDIGHPSYRWDDIRATNSSIVTSDRNEKENITATDLGLEFVNKLTPVSFKRKGKTRTHYGLIAQDVETVITDLGKTSTQFAPLIKDTLKDGSERYGLRYTELIAPLVKAIQELSAKVAALEAA